MSHTTIEGRLLAEPTDRFAIVVARWNDLVTSRLLGAALSTLKRHGAADDAATVVYVPGSFEIPIVAEKLVVSEKYVAVICLGAVIQGETTHHEYINHPVARELMQIGVRYGVPVTFGILTCSSMEQAIDRSGGKAGNKGTEATLAAIELVSVLKQLAATEE